MTDIYFSHDWISVQMNTPQSRVAEAIHRIGSMCHLELATECGINADIARVTCVVLSSTGFITESTPRPGVECANEKHYRPTFRARKFFKMELPSEFTGHEWVISALDAGVDPVNAFYEALWTGCLTKTNNGKLQKDGWWLHV